MSKTYFGPLFLIGYGRSGTKLLRAILAAHPRLAIGDIETNFFPEWIINWDRFGDLSVRHLFEQFYNKVLTWPYFVYQQERGAVLTADEWYNAITEFSAAGVFEALVRHDCGAPRDGDVIWGDKSPNHTRHVGLLKQAFPDARFIHIVRDVRDVAASSARAWGSHPIRIAQRWADSVLEPGAQASTFAEDLLEIRYEDLTDNPERVIRTICGFVEIEYFPELIELRESPEKVGDARGRRIIVAGNTNKANDVFSHQMIREIESVTCVALAHFKYPLVNGKPVIRVPAIRMMLYRSYDGLHHLARQIRGRGFRKGVAFVWRFFIQNIRSGL